MTSSKRAWTARPFVWCPREFQAATIREDGDKALYWLRTVYREMRAEGRAS